MLSVKPGRGPSAAGGVSMLFAAGFGVLWTIFTFCLTSDTGGEFGFVHIIFPGFGVLFTLAALCGAFYNFRNVGARERLSMVDITTDKEEGDPLNRWARGTAALEPSEEKSVEERLKELQRLKEKGLISADEEKQQRARILGEV